MSVAKGSVLVPLEDRFWAKVDRRGYDECWPWTGATALSGGRPYGRIYVGGHLRSAHRVAFYLVHGRWPEPQALHGCDYTLCCNAENPAHIYEGTEREKVRRMFAQGRGSLPPVRTGARANRSKLSDEQAREVIARYGDGGVISQKKLAAEYGVSQSTIQYTLRGKRRSLQ